MSKRGRSGSPSGSDELPLKKKKEDGSYDSGPEEEDGSILEDAKELGVFIEQMKNKGGKIEIENLYFLAEALENELKIVREQIRRVEGMPGEFEKASEEDSSILAKAMEKERCDAGPSSMPLLMSDEQMERELVDEQIKTWGEFEEDADPAEFSEDASDEGLVIPATQPFSPEDKEVAELAHTETGESGEGPATPSPPCQLPPAIIRFRAKHRRRNKSYLPDFQLPDIPVDKESAEAKLLAEMVAPTKKETPSRPLQPKGFQIFKAGYSYTNEDKEKKKKNKRWKWIPLRSRIMKWRDVQEKKKKLPYPYPVRWIQPKGFTEWEYLVCEGYMSWYNFEFYFPIKEKGYGVTRTNPQGFRGPNFIRFDATSYEKNFTLNIYMTNMVLALIGAIQSKFKDFRPAGLQLTNAVVCGQYHMYLLSHSFERQMITRECKGSKGGEEEVEVDVVQAMFYVAGPRVASPLEIIHFNIEEWKLLKGSRLVYSTASTKGAKEFLERRHCDTRA